MNPKKPDVHQAPVVPAEITHMSRVTVDNAAVVDSCATTVDHHDNVVMNVDAAEMLR